MLHPLCGYPLQRGTILLSIIEISFAVLFLIQNCISLSSYIPQALEERSFAAENPSTYQLKIYSMKSVIIMLNSLYWITSLLLGVLLYIGSKQKDLRKCRQWFIITCILTVLFIVDVLMQTFSMRATMEEITSPVVGTVLLTYMIWVVNAYMEELRLGGCLPMKSQMDIPQLN